jgi:hypothetical protein
MLLAGLGLDLELHLLFAQPGRQHDPLGDDGRTAASPAPACRVPLFSLAATSRRTDVGDLVELLRSARRRIGAPVAAARRRCAPSDELAAGDAWPSSTSLTLVELMSRPIIAGASAAEAGSKSSRRLTLNAPRE